MHLGRKLFLQVKNVVKRHYATKPKLTIELEEDVNNKLTENLIKPKKQPGKIQLTPRSLPEEILEAIKRSLGDTPERMVIRDGLKLTNMLKSRHVPCEEWQVKDKRKEIIRSLGEQLNIDHTDKTPEDIENIQKSQEKKIEKLLKEKIFSWKAIRYDKYMSLCYLVARSAPDYAVLCRLFGEINTRLPDYKPHSFFDFGSGVGTGLWAAKKIWGDSLEEIFTVDPSVDMNNLARLILCDGVENAEIPFKKFFQRQFLPSTPSKYNVILSAYSLFELPSAQSRLLTIQNLWRKATDFLILVEQGTNAGFNILSEARDFILEVKEGPLVGHVFSPCPHDLQCPRFLNDNTPCNFPVPYFSLKLGVKSILKNEYCSYIILRKGKREEYGSEWPRLVRPVLVKTGHTVCKLCVEGKLTEVIFTKSKHGKYAYQCARSSNWGDRLPIKIKTEDDIINLTQETDALVDSDMSNENTNANNLSYEVDSEDKK